MSNAKYKYVRIQRKIFLEDDLAMIFIDFVCYVAYTAKYLTYLLKSTEVIQIWEFDNLHMTQCAKIIVGFRANVGNVFLSNVYKRFLFSPRFLTFFNVFVIFISTFITSMTESTRYQTPQQLQRQPRSTTKKGEIQPIATL